MFDPRHYSLLRHSVCMCDETVRVHKRHACNITPFPWTSSAPAQDVSPFFLPPSYFVSPMHLLPMHILMVMVPRTLGVFGPFRLLHLFKGTPQASCEYLSYSLGIHGLQGESYPPDGS
jgi:hypothetical protein